jgi:hypothetical protein
MAGGKQKLGKQTAEITDQGKRGNGPRQEGGQIQNPRMRKNLNHEIHETHERDLEFGFRV